MWLIVAHDILEKPLHCTEGKNKIQTSFVFTSEKFGEIQLKHTGGTLKKIKNQCKELEETVVKDGNKCGHPPWWWSDGFLNTGTNHFPMCYFPIFGIKSKSCYSLTFYIFAYYLWNWHRFSSQLCLWLNLCKCWRGTAACHVTSRDALGVRTPCLWNFDWERDIICLLLLLINLVFAIALYGNITRLFVCFFVFGSHSLAFKGQGLWYLKDCYERATGNHEKWPT